jgi:hypothetical protein
MRKVLIVVFGFATFGALASVQPAFAVTKKNCTRHVISSPQNCAGKPNCTVTSIDGGLGTKECYTVDVGPAPTAYKGNSASATQTHNPSRNPKAK